MINRAPGSLGARPRSVSAPRSWSRRRLRRWLDRRCVRSPVPGPGRKSL